MEARYFQNKEIVAKLLEQYKKHQNLIVAIDFDDTIYPNVLKDTCKQVISLARRISKLGFTIILFTCRENEQLDWAVSLTKALGINVTYVNECPTLNSRKPYYNILLDDKAGLGQAYECLLEAVNIIEKQ